jgi:hypothetical protein
MEVRVFWEKSTCRKGVKIKGENGPKDTSSPVFAKHCPALLIF